MQYELVLDHKNQVRFAEWPSAVRYFMEQTSAMLHDMIELYEGRTLVFRWVRGKGIVMTHTNEIEMADQSHK